MRKLTFWTSLLLLLPWLSPSNARATDATSKVPATAQRPASPGKAATPRGKAPKGKVPGIGKKATRSAGPAKPADPATRRAVAGVSAVEDADRRVEPPEVLALREAERELFGVAGRSSPSLVTDQPVALSLDPSRPTIYANGLPPPSSLRADQETEAVQNTAWMSSLVMPDLPVHWNSRLIRYLDFYKNDARGRSIATIWIRRSGRYEGALKKQLRDNHVPEDLFWVSMVESAMNPVAYSPVGAAGLWQFMPETGRQYGLVVDRWIDERLDPERSTIAASKFLQDLYRRFGTWELALAAYNMGYGGLLSAIRKYNTNDFWDLCQYEAGIPWETTLYVPKIISLAILAKNPAVFGLEGVQKDLVVAYDSVNVGPGVALSSVAAAAQINLDTVQSLNPQILASRVPPQASDSSGTWAVRVPSGMAAKVNLNILKERAREPRLERHVVRFGESLQDIAQSRGTTMRNLATINALANDEVPRPGTVLLVPARPRGGPGEDAATGKIVVVVAYDLPAPAGYRRLFYRVVPGDTLSTISGAFGVSPDDVRRWNALDPIGRLQEGMSLLVMVPLERDVSNIMARSDNEVRVMVVGSEEFFGHFEALKDRVRTTIAVGSSDTWQTIARRTGLSLGMLERINRRSRSSKLVVGERLVVYVAQNSALAKPASAANATRADSKPNPAAAPAEAPVEDPESSDDDKDESEAPSESPEAAKIKSP